MVLLTIMYFFKIINATELILDWLLGDSFRSSENSVVPSLWTTLKSPLVCIWVIRAMSAFRVNLSFPEIWKYVDNPGTKCSQCRWQDRGCVLVRSPWQAVAHRPDADRACFRKRVLLKHSHALWFTPRPWPLCWSGTQSLQKGTTWLTKPETLTACPLQNQVASHYSRAMQSVRIAPWYIQGLKGSCGKTCLGMESSQKIHAH